MKGLEKYFEAVTARLKKGDEEYANKSFSKSPTKLLKELQEEALDLAGWGFIIYTRLKSAEAALGDQHEVNFLRSEKDRLTLENRRLEASVAELTRRHLRAIRALEDVKEALD